MTQDNTNLNIWQSVERTDPAYTKEFTRSGGFKGTAISPAYMVKRATETFGPMGLGWGLDIVNEELIDGAPLVDANGVLLGHEKIHKLLVSLWYVVDGKRGEVKQFGQTVFIGRNKWGFYTDEEAAKKSMTDAMTKCLSLLGFGADVYLGKFDDNKYKAESRRYFEQGAVETKPKPKVDRSALSKPKPANPVSAHCYQPTVKERDVALKIKEDLARGTPIDDLIKRARKMEGISEIWRKEIVDRLDARRAAQLGAKQTIRQAA